ncbi:NAD(P)-dependent dehydrogenase (short-subunit alcohol dehydrogenase family) [Amycolatopsis bartoniae]|uniref:Short-chain dehydrogenase/reductase n=1 Tax=Amycolatopsis bartoniae TaxID=941986 RepID=A0A8H9J1W5_9PSEU|nr:SDR family NAD(P)-dependent oxidoreductase [Amycolatopsis bartoniae]MBB2935857.1 NAD(P)-dependent dehydrogenase (short-subunit alcohol dehydrogenase family) [Amycolatopsis bartoniae]TVT04994.1 SDR family NAD(P)-dependent oxidoreductase [Amycolatopsis bartoniae]GHF62357.1 short-chain dehydrogenase/reductase [Amycolatopsis bartoniae]
MTQIDSKRRRVWFITGTSSGMGYAIAKAALEHGDLVAATARNTRALEELVTDFPGQALTIDLDVRDEEAVKMAVSRTIGEFRRIDVVVNNAGFALVGPVEGTSDKQARDLFDTGFFGALNVLRAALPVLRSQRSGHVLHMSSIFGEMSFPGTGMLAAVKQALGGATQAMGAELAPLGIKFTQIEPGALHTRFLAKWIVAEHAIADYDDTAGATLEGLKDLPPEAIADVSRVAAAILELVDAEQPPLRLALGSWAGEIIRKEIAGRSTDFENWSHLTKSVDNS